MMNARWFLYLRILLAWLLVFVLALSILMIWHELLMAFLVNTLMLGRYVVSFLHALYYCIAGLCLVGLFNLALDYLGRSAQKGRLLHGLFIISGIQLLLIALSQAGLTGYGLLPADWLGVVVMAAEGLAGARMLILSRRKNSSPRRILLRNADSVIVSPRRPKGSMVPKRMAVAVQSGSGVTQTPRPQRKDVSAFIDGLTGYNPPRSSRNGGLKKVIRGIGPHGSPRRGDRHGEWKYSIFPPGTVRFCPQGGIYIQSREMRRTPNEERYFVIPSGGWIQPPLAGCGAARRPGGRVASFPQSGGKAACFPPALSAGDRHRRQAD